MSRIYYKVYQDYLRLQDNKTRVSLEGIRGQVKHLFKLVGLSGVRIPYAQPVGYGQIAAGQINTVDNLDNLYENVVATNVGLFERAIGECRSRFIQSFNPIFWFETILYMPSNVLEYLGARAGGTITRLFQVLWWLIVAAATIIGVVFNHDFTTWFMHHII